ncbi:hypothetical protein LTS18_005089 [Coniosporium uncinatum]|uniref:Uncharacterized protein n=1 Tax=Coniosporium uncinatum TaxID=93489 RepID=A0ACC3DRH1_9PEZI|nr:hypothetical protein LTS18_005089 [Coniosporium uncinatum]
MTTRPAQTPILVRPLDAAFNTDANKERAGRFWGGDVERSSGEELLDDDEAREDGVWSDDEAKEELGFAEEMNDIEEAELA